MRKKQQHSSAILHCSDPTVAVIVVRLVSSPFERQLEQSVGGPNDFL